MAENCFVFPKIKIALMQFRFNMHIRNKEAWHIQGNLFLFAFVLRSSYNTNVIACLQLYNVNLYVSLIELTVIYVLSLLHMIFRCQHVVGVEAPPDTPVSTTETTIGGSEPVATIAWQLFDIGFKRPLFSVKLQEMNLFFGIPSV